MRTEKIHTLILGAGPSGLATAYTLARAGLQPVVLEKDKVVGGLMRSLRHGDFILDIGRKELYNRLARVDAFWSDLLGSDYRSYANRGGILYDGTIIDMSPAYRGFRRGMPWSMLLGCAIDFLWWRVRPGLPKPTNLEEYFHQKRGRRLTRVACQAFQEKLNGKKWVDIPIADMADGDADESFVWTLRQALSRFFTQKESNHYKGMWRHPARGTGQICDALQQGMEKAGGRIHFEARLLEMSASEGRVNSVTADVGGETVVYQPQYVVSGAPPEFLERLLLNPPPAAAGNKEPPRSPAGVKRTVVLVYLFLDESPRFPHFYLHVTSPRMRIGRIANYAALGSDMVPKGKTCLCCEIYCFGDDPLLNSDNRAIAETALADCAEEGLVDAAKCFDTFVLRLPGADASQNVRNWLTMTRRKLFQELEQFQNLYCVSRTDLDVSTLAGLEAADAIMSGNRGDFDRRVDLTTLEDRSAPKPFEFRIPAGAQT